MLQATMVFRNDMSYPQGFDCARPKILRVTASYGAARLFFACYNFGTKISGLISLPNFLGRFGVIVLSLYWSSAPQAAAQDIGRLYAARPPAGYAFLRVAKASGSKATENVQIDFSEALIDDAAVASRYRAVRADKPVRISVGGSEIDEKIIPLADQFSTIVIRHDGSSWKSYLIEEGQSNVNDLKAQLRFFNLAPGCEATLKIVDGSLVFDATATQNVRSRAINPVKTRLESFCKNRNATFTLPELQAGDHFSLFLRERDGGALSLSGQFDETEPYRER
jgi:alginate O-acetyltransferase complex protein AlgF